jgi:hypothetical protein
MWSGAGTDRRNDRKRSATPRLQRTAHPGRLEHLLHHDREEQRHPYVVDVKGEYVREPEVALCMPVRPHQCDRNGP